MITQSQYEALKAKGSACYSFSHEGKAYVPNGLAPADRLTNDETSALEVFEFCHNPPQRYFAYVSHQIQGSGYGTVTTWVGETLGTITYYGRAFHLFGNPHNKARHIRVKAINGKIYTGVYYQSAGDYCRLSLVKQES